MSAHCTSSVFAMTERDNGLWGNNNRHPFSDSYSKKLHEPGCISQCCSTGFSQVIQSNNYSDLEQPLIPGESVEYILTPVSSENFFLYDPNTSYDKVPENQGIISRKVVDNSEMAYSELCYRRPVENSKFSHFCKSRVEPECIKRSYCKGVVKRKRKRTVFTTEQIIAMEGVFKKRPYVSREERLVLTRRLSLSEKAIKIWFQNRRRTTERREKDQSDSCHSDSTVEEMFDAHTSRLDYIESQINQSTDENGIVTLDNETITELVTLISNVLSHSIDYNNTLFENKSNDIYSESYLMYEPISPESLSEENNETEHNISKWEPSEPEESLQRLIDIQTVLYS